jgi:hypothetical protein
LNQLGASFVLVSYKKTNLHELSCQYGVMHGVLRPYAIFREKLVVSHGITWCHPLSSKRVDIDGATTFAVYGM